MQDNEQASYAEEGRQSLTSDTSGISVDAARLQERDQFTGIGWTKALAPAKVNLHLAIGQKTSNGYHEAVSVMHALTLHDTVYVRPLPQDVAAGDCLGQEANQRDKVDMVACNDVVLPDIAPGANIVHVALSRLRAEKGDAAFPLEIRIEKNIPAQAGLGGGSSDAAAALRAVAQLWGIGSSDPCLERIAASLGADVAFFLRGGCCYLDGVGDVFRHELTPRTDTVVLIKPEQGVSTAAAYAAFDTQPSWIDAGYAAHVFNATEASTVQLYNNLTAAAEQVLPDLRAIREWFAAELDPERVLLCGSGSALFGIVDTFQEACALVGKARQRKLWARTTAFSPLGACVC